MTTSRHPVTLFSLTENGRAVAERLAGGLSGFTHLHRPDSFADAARAAFSDGHRCIFICATGIVIRTLAPILQNKQTDPAVLVLDEHGEYVIPLLSGHEGGGSVFGRQVAEILGARLVNTSATDYSRPVYTLGVGSDKGCPAELIDDLFQQSLTTIREPVTFSAIASIDLKQNEAGILALAGKLQLPLECFPATQLRAVENQLSSRSEIVFREVGCYGVAEAAALLAASAITGNPAELVVRKQKNSRSTLSVARSYR